MISPPSGIRRPSYNGAPAMRDSKDQLSNRESYDAATKTRATHTKLACLHQPAKKSTRTSLAANVCGRVCPRRSNRRKAEVRG